MTESLIVKNKKEMSNSRKEMRNTQKIKRKENSHRHFSKTEGNQHDSCMEICNSSSACIAHLSVNSHK
jgi:predicted SAM-dependent methyltransferase